MLFTYEDEEDIGRFSNLHLTPGVYLILRKIFENRQICPKEKN